VDNLLESVKWLYSEEGLKTIIATGGLLGLIGIVFAETGLLVGFFLPGDSLLVTAGIFSTPDSALGQLFDPVVLISCLCVAAIVGDQLNYALGRKTGEAVYNRPDSRFIKRKYFEQARDFYQAHGASAIVIARFVPIRGLQRHRRHQLGREHGDDRLLHRRDPARVGSQARDPGRRVHLADPALRRRLQAVARRQARRRSQHARSRLKATASAGCGGL
jgi:membrane protein YqaA with SNARE-associated domain